MLKLKLNFKIVNDGSQTPNFNTYIYVYIFIYLGEII